MYALYEVNESIRHYGLYDRYVVTDELVYRILEVLLEEDSNVLNQAAMTIAKSLSNPIPK